MGVGGKGEYNSGRRLRGGGGRCGLGWEGGRVQGGERVRKKYYNKHYLHLL